MAAVPELGWQRSPAALLPSPGARVASSAWRGRGTAGEQPPLAAAAYLRPFQSTWSTERCQEAQVGRHLPAARRTRREAFPSRCTHALINNQLGPEAGHASDKCLGQRKICPRKGTLDAELVSLLIRTFFFKDRQPRSLEGWYLFEPLARK
ncbi:uncharacterized protein LOC118570394 isoform X6 [Onychomys torridus]|uniref:uncharacterized protein LOC118570394 isoform X6 n=1 Tax=Onychomys torridus TaxID=38674 RepID=UPI00167FBC70|nr:uncharacterized protein LOC118570394 isoform X6 [Onychomys torridus]